MKLDIAGLTVEVFYIGSEPPPFFVTADCTVKCDDTQQRSCGYTDCTCVC